MGTVLGWQLGEGGMGAVVGGSSGVQLGEWGYRGEVVWGQ